MRDPSAPRPNFSADVRSGSLPLEVAFTDLSEPGSSEITDWKWSFGDGEFSDETNPTHTYQNAGVYDVPREKFQQPNELVEGGNLGGAGP